jgi:hypothetical protein
MNLLRRAIVRCGGTAIERNVQNLPGLAL